MNKKLKIFALVAMLIGSTYALYQQTSAPKVGAASCLKGQDGGTGLGTCNQPTAGDVGKFLKLSGNSPVTYVLDTPAGGGGGGSGTVTTSSAVSTNNFPFWATTGGALSGTSTLTISGTQLLQNGAFNATGTISQSGVAVLTTSTGLTVSNFASPNISQWTNNSGYITTSTGLSVSNFASPNISQWTNNSGYVTSTGANPSATLGLTAVNGTANTFMRSDGAPALSQAIAPNWTNVHNFTAGLIGTSTFAWGGNGIFSGFATAPTGIFNNLIQGGSVVTFATSTTITGPQFCSGGIYVASSTPGAATITLPGTSTIASTCSLSPWTWNENIIMNQSTNTVSVVLGSGMTQYGGAGNTTVLSPGDMWVSKGVVPTNSTSTALSILTDTFSTSTVTSAIPYATSTGQFKALTIGSGLSLTATGTLLATGGGGGSISSSSAITAGYFAPWATTAGGLNGTSSLYWDSTNLRVGLGTTAPSSSLHIVGGQLWVSSSTTSTVNSLRLYHDGASSTITTGTGGVNITPTGNLYVLAAGTGVDLNNNAGGRLFLSTGSGNAELYNFGNRQSFKQTYAAFTDAVATNDTWLFSSGESTTRSTGFGQGMTFYFGTASNATPMYVARIVPYWEDATSASAKGAIGFDTFNTNVATRRMTLANNGNLGLSTTAPSSTLHVNGNFQLSASSSFVTASIGGGLLTAGTCASATSSIDTSVTSSTAAFVVTPQNYPGDGAEWYAYLSAPGVATTKVCALASVTPTATPYVVKILK